MINCSYRSQFKRHLTTGIPEGYNIGASARPYGEIRKIKIAGIKFYHVLSYTYGQMQ